MHVPAQIKTGLPDALPGNPAVFARDPWLSDPAFLRVWLCLKKIGVEARNPTANAPPHPFAPQPPAEMMEKSPFPQLRPIEPIC